MQNPSTQTKGYIGKIIRIYVECHGANVFDHQDVCDLEAQTLADAAKEVRSLGWKLDRVHGWLCPSCKELI